MVDDPVALAMPSRRTRPMSGGTPRGDPARVPRRRSSSARTTWRRAPSTPRPIERERRVVLLEIELEGCRRAARARASSSPQANGLPAPGAGGGRNGPIILNICPSPPSGSPACECEPSSRLGYPSQLAATASWSGANMTPQVDVTTSKLASSYVIASASPTSNCALDALLARPAPALSRPERARGPGRRRRRRAPRRGSRPRPCR